MSFRTFGDLREQVEAEMDTEDESFVQPAEMQRYFNSAITICEATIVKLGLREKYLQSEFFIDTVQGQTDYALPGDIVATKIRKVIYRNSNIVYTMHPLKREDSYVIEDAMAIVPTSEYYHFSLYKVGVNTMFRITPRAVQSVAQAIRMIYMKTLQRYAAETTPCDVPDICYEFIMSYVRYRIYAKETHTNTQDEKANMQAFLVLMQETLQNQVADPTMDEIDQDMSHYNDMN